MYIPEHFRVRDHADELQFMRGNPFAILVSTGDAGPFASHIPIALRENGDQLLLRGHFAKANPHWRYLEQRPQVLTIFHGPHSYISPTLYTSVENVPTWNYAAIHTYGDARLYTSEQDLQAMLHELIATFEQAYATQWASLSESYRHRMLGHIVGFEIPVEKLEGKFKLGQNRSKQEQANLMEALGCSHDTAISGVARLMQEQGLGLPPKKQDGE